MPMENGLTSVADFCKELAATQDRQELGHLIVRGCAAAAAAETASLYVLDAEHGRYAPLAAHGPSSPQVQTIPASAEHDQLLPLSHSQGPLAVPSLGPGATLFPSDTTIVLPLLTRGRLLGFCAIGSRSGDTTEPADQAAILTLLGFCAALALDNALLWHERRQTRLLMRRSDRMRSVETMAAGFAHEIRNPLTSIKTFVTLAPDRHDDAEFMSRFSQVAAEDVARIERLIGEILDYARSVEPEFSREDVNDVVASSLHFLDVSAKDRSLQITKQLAEGLPLVTLDRHQIQQVFMNLFINAVESMAGRTGRLTVATRQMTKHGTEVWVQIEITDTGCGIAADTLEHIFDPFFTTKHESAEREGTGLGLAIAHQIVRDHGGYLDVTSQPGKGSSFFVNLPADPPGRAQAPRIERRRPTR